MMNMLKQTAKNNPFGLAKSSSNLVMEPSPPDEPKTSTNNPMGQMRRDSTYIIVGPKGDKTTKNAYDLYADLGMDNNLEAIQERIKKRGRRIILYNVYNIYCKVQDFSQKI